VLETHLAVLVKQVQVHQLDSFGQMRLQAIKQVDAMSLVSGIQICLAEKEFTSIQQLTKLRQR
jgi:hypothetical protein